MVHGFLEAFVSIISAVYHDGTRKPRLQDILEYMDFYASIGPSMGENVNKGSHFQKLRSHVSRLYYAQIGTNQALLGLRVDRLSTDTLMESLSDQARTVGYWDVVLQKWRHRHGIVGWCDAFVLRSSDQHDTLIGACVVLEWMNGLPVDERESGNLALSSYYVV